jgi:hypothetical protein
MVDERVMFDHNNFIFLINDTENISNEIVIKIKVKMPFYLV